MSVITRFAPSPTGLLHVGNIRLALINWLFTRQCGGTFLLRLDDTDRVRSTIDFEDAIKEDLQWLGLRWDAVIHQSARLDHYRDAAEVLQKTGRLYPCYETSEQLRLKRKNLLVQGLPPIYDREGLHLSSAQRAELEASGHRPHWRFRLDEEAIEWSDLVHGPIRFDTTTLSDPILIREDTSPLYTFSSVVDDIAYSISHVIRGADHIANTGIQIGLWKALGGTVPCFAHLPLLTDSIGQGLSKRLDSSSIQHMREKLKLEPMTILSFLAKIGTSDPIAPYSTLDPLIAQTDFTKYSRAPIKFDIEELKRLNACLLHILPFSEVVDRLEDQGISDVSETFWHVVRPNLRTLDEAKEWGDVIHDRVNPVMIDHCLTKNAADLLPSEPWDETTWQQWIDQILKKTDRRGKALFRPLRLALTGYEQGPELKFLLPLIGRQRVYDRLTGKVA